MIDITLICKLIKMTLTAWSLSNRIYNVIGIRNRILGKLCPIDNTGKSIEDISWTDFYDQMSPEEITELSMCIVEFVIFVSAPFEEYLFQVKVPDLAERERQRELTSLAMRGQKEISAAKIIGPLFGIPLVEVYKAFRENKVVSDTLMPYVISVLINSYKGSQGSDNSSNSDS